MVHKKTRSIALFNPSSASIFENPQGHTSIDSTYLIVYPIRLFFIPYLTHEMKVVLLATIAASLTLGVDAFLDGGRAGDNKNGASGAGGKGGKGGDGKSGNAKSGPGGAGGTIGGKIDAKSGAGGSGGSVTNNVGPYQQGPQVFYGSVSGPVGNTIGGGNANGASSGGVNANPNYTGATSKGGDSKAETGKANGAAGAPGGSTGNTIGNSKTGSGGGGPQLSLSIPSPVRRALISRAVQEALGARADPADHSALRRRHLAAILARQELDTPIDLYAREAYADPEPFAYPEDSDDHILSREAEPKGFFKMDYAMYKRSADAEPEYLEADLSLYPRESDYDDLDLQTREVLDEDGLFDIYARDASEFEGRFWEYS